MNNEACPHVLEYETRFGVLVMASSQGSLLQEPEGEVSARRDRDLLEAISQQQLFLAIVPNKLDRHKTKMIFACKTI